MLPWEGHQGNPDTPSRGTRPKGSARSHETGFQVNETRILNQAPVCVEKEKAMDPRTSSPMRSSPDTHPYSLKPRVPPTCHLGAFYLLVAVRNSKRGEVTEGTEWEIIGMLCGPQHLDFLFVTTSGLIRDTHESERHRLFS